VTASVIALIPMSIFIFTTFCVRQTVRPWSRSSQERGLATLERITPQVVTVQFDQVEGVQENASVIVAVANAIERSDAIVITGNRVPVDDAGARAQTG
jgi:hypothetical protein